MNNLRTMLAVTAVVAMAVAFLASPGRATADKPVGCQQWEVMLGSVDRMAIDARALPQADKQFVERAPAGWEPFAFGPTGQLVYRRCAK